MKIQFHREINKVSHSNWQGEVMKSKLRVNKCAALIPKVVRKFKSDIGVKISKPIYSNRRLRKMGSKMKVLPSNDSSLE